MQAGGEKAGLPQDSIQLIPFTDRESVDHLAKMDRYLDLIIPRGGKGLIERVVQAARMPVIKHYDGVCHVYVHHTASHEMAANLILNGKCQKPSACNAVETVLVDREGAEDFYATLREVLRPSGVEVRGDAGVLAVWPGAKPPRKRTGARSTWIRFCPSRPFQALTKPSSTSTPMAPTTRTSSFPKMPP